VTARKEMLFRIKFARVHRPYTLVFGVVLLLPGVLAVIYGDQVSRALESISTGPLSRIMGVALLSGSLITLVGIARGRSLWEALGLTLVAAGTAIYGIGVIMGLGLAGMVAGPCCLGISLGSTLRVVSLLTSAHQINMPPEGD